MKKKIGISYTKTNFPNYWNWFSKEELGNEFELTELSFEKNNVQDISSCDGFILTGGIDVDPSFYGERAEYPNRPDHFQTDRDRFEEKIYRHAQANRLPVLGICRGLQLVNVLEGGKLVQDLGNSNDIHRKIETDKEHGVHVVEGTLLSEILEQPDGIVNSAHHQAVDPRFLGKNLQVSAYAGPGNSIVEGIEFREKQGRPFMLCVQWHPERMRNKEENSFSKNIKKKFLEEVQKSSIPEYANHQSGN